MLLLLAGKMFTTGRIIFSIIFVIGFITLMIFSYKKDATVNYKQYKNTGKYVAIGLLLTLAILYISKHLVT